VDWIDVHHHFAPPDYVTALGKSNIPIPMQRWTAQASIDDMDQFGVATSLLSITVPGIWFGDDAEARRVARICNEHGAELSARYPGRFGFFASIPYPDVAGSLAEIAYALDVLKADGINLYTSYGDRWLGHESLAPIYDELHRRKATAYVHPVTNDCCKELLPDIISATIEYGTDTTRAIADFVFSGMAPRYPDMRMIFSHGGGTMPFLIGRFVSQAEEPKLAARLPHGVLHELRKLYYDTAQVNNRGAMLSLLDLVPLSQVVFGTDFPYRSAGIYAPGLRTAGLSDDDLQQIGRGNVLPLLAVPR
jgi:predicted TIM-barrel fold metal-dependent hydrolase